MWEDVTTEGEEEDGREDTLMRAAASGPAGSGLNSSLWSNDAALRLEVVSHKTLLAGDDAEEQEAKASLKCWDA